MRLQNARLGLENEAATEIQRFAQGMLSRWAWAQLMDAEALRLAEEERRESTTKPLLCL